MPSVRIIRRRIRSVRSTAKITKAMEMVATSQMRRAQHQVLAARPYAEKMREVLADLAARQSPDEAIHPLLREQHVERILVIHITADRGLAGGFNANMNRRTGSFLLSENVPAELVTVGRKGRDFMLRYGRDLRAEFTNLPSRPSLLDTLPISRIVMDDYTAGRVGRVYVAYSEFVNTIVQRPTIRQLLPVQPPARSSARPVDYIYEPDPATVLAALLPRYVEMQVYHAILESLASEYSARMVAMRNATENANELIQDLTLMYNKARQESITSELLDISGGAAALA